MAMAGKHLTVSSAGWSPITQGILAVLNGLFAPESFRPCISRLSFNTRYLFMVILDYINSWPLLTSFFHYVWSNGVKSKTEIKPTYVFRYAILPHKINCLL